MRKYIAIVTLIVAPLVTAARAEAQWLECLDCFYSTLTGSHITCWAPVILGFDGIEHCKTPYPGGCFENHAMRICDYASAEDQERLMTAVSLDIAEATALAAKYPSILRINHEIARLDVVHCSTESPQWSVEIAPGS